MKASEYRERSAEELLQMSQDLQQDLFNLRFQHATGQLDDVSKLKQSKRDLARIKTILRENEMGIKKLTASGSTKPSAED
jgi:large subunit ribosomal protein L29